ncbi:MAG TPA: hypothetical protein VKZ60_14415 [Chloroflexota bacterium]|nr:hypothetical protein [Chloroflexota bacterium]
MRRLVLAAAILASTTAAMAPVAHAQGGPGIGFGPPTPGYGGVPMVPSSAPARPQAESSAPTTPDACRLGVARAAYPMVTQMVRYANAFQAYPMGPNGRPLLAPTPLLYPGFAGSIYNPFGAPGYNLANIYGLQNLNAILLQPAAFAPFLSGTLSYPDLVAHVFSADSQRLAYIDSRINAANLNAALTIFPLDVAALFKEVVEGLQLYADLACGQASAPAASNSDSSGTDSGAATNGSSNGAARP